MPREQADASYLWDILTAAQAERQVEIIGEAARRLSDAFRQQHPEIPWFKIIGQRHVLAHDYGEIKHDRLWRVATVHVPALIEQIEPLLPPPPKPQADQ